jgi:3-oxoacyl-[acyl-carrier protein] reductase
MSRLKDKVAIVTGAGSGLGAGIARAFAREEASVVVADISVAAGKAIADEIAAAGGKVIAAAADVSVEAGFESLTRRAFDVFGKLDIVVNCAGYTQPFLPVAEISEAVFDKLFAVNVKSLFWCVKYAVPRMVEDGVIVNIASMGAIRPRPNLCWYNASKGAVEVATKALAIELAPRRIRVCAINPTTADTPMIREMLAGQDQSIIDDLAKTIPLGRLCSPEDVADTAVFLASNEARFLTGACINVDGGRAI